MINQYTCTEILIGFASSMLRSFLESQISGYWIYGADSNIKNNFLFFRPTKNNAKFLNNYRFYLVLTILTNGIFPDYDFVVFKFCSMSVYILSKFLHF